MENNNFQQLEEKFQELEKALGFSFKDKRYLINAFVHRSFLNENQWIELPHNERLEFLGDAVLELVVTEYLYNEFPNQNEGALTVWRSSLVNSNMLSKKASEANFESFLLLSRGEQKDTGKARQFILANTYEAYIGALYLDQGYGACKKFIEQGLIKEELNEIVSRGTILDAKSHFQERAQEIERLTPNYQLIEEWGPDHEKHFKVGVYLGEELVATGEGSSKKEAEEEAAKNAFKAKGWR